MADGIPAAGWYEDPLDDTVCRWWDGAAWTDDVRSLAGAVIENAASPPNQAPTAPKPPVSRPTRKRRRVVLVVAAAVALLVGGALVGVATVGDGDDPRVERLTSVGLVTCAHLEGGDLRCWGGDERMPRVPTIQGAKPVSAADDHACGVRGDGSVLCSGSNQYGQLGRDGDEPPRAVAGLPPVTQVAVAEGFSCALDREGGVWCWGSNRFGQLGGPALPPVNTIAHQVPEVSDAVGVLAAGGHACARIRNGTARCWGRANRGQLGTGAVADVVAPAPVGDLDHIEQLAIGDWSGCAVLQDGKLWCWGDDTLGQTSAARRMTEPQPDPLRVDPGARVRDVAVGTFHTCVLIGDRDVRCWGAGADGQLGPGREFGSVKPVRIEL